MDVRMEEGNEVANRRKRKGNDKGRKEGRMGRRKKGRYNSHRNPEEVERN